MDTNSFTRIKKHLNGDFTQCLSVMHCNSIREVLLAFNSDPLGCEILFTFFKNLLKRPRRISDKSMVGINEWPL